jgi:nucleoside phosphorylase
MTTPAARTRVALMAPMKPELAPLVRMLKLERSTLAGRTIHVGSAGDVDVVAYKTGIGTGPAIEATEHALAHAHVDHVIVVGVAGGMGPTVGIGDLVVPEVVVDRPNGMSEHHPVPLGGVTPRGTIITSDEFGYDAEQTQAFIDDGVVAVDMETGPIGRLCEAAGMPWSTFRAISDRADDDTVDIAMLEMAGTDGSGDFGAVARYLLRRPWKIVHLARMAKGSKQATEAAAAAAIRGCASVKAGRGAD